MDRLGKRGRAHAPWSRRFERLERRRARDDGWEEERGGLDVEAGFAELRSYIIRTIQQLVAAGCPWLRKAMFVFFTSMDIIAVRPRRPNTPHRIQESGRGTVQM